MTSSSEQFLSWSDYGPIFVNSPDLVQEKPPEALVSPSPKPDEPQIGSPREFPEIISNVFEFELEDQQNPVPKTPSIDRTHQGHKRSPHQLTPESQHLRPSPVPILKDRASPRRGSIMFDPEKRRLSFFDPDATSSKRASFDIGPANKDPKRLSLYDAQTSRRSSFAVNDVSRRSSTFLEVPMTDAQKRQRRNSAQIPTGAIMNKNAREKLIEFIFKDDPEFLKLEEPLPEAPRRRLKQVDLKKFAQIDEHTESIPTTAEREFDEILIYLFDNSHVVTQLQKIRAIFHYITTRTIEEIPQLDRLQELTPIAFFSGIKHGALSLYTLLFEIFCRYARIPCVTIEGWVKPRNFKPGDKLGDHCLHAWNAAFVDGEWFLFDIAFGSTESDPIRFPSSRPGSQLSNRSVLSSSSGSGNDPNQLPNSPTAPKHDNAHRGSGSSLSSVIEFLRRFGTAEDYYFCPVPEDFIFTHYPFESKWQLLQDGDYLTKRSFEKLAVIRDDFFMMGLNVTEESHFTTLVKTETGVAKFVFRLPVSFVLQFKVSLRCTKGANEGKEFPNSVFFYRDQTKIVFETRLTFSGSFMMSFFCRHQPTDELDEEEAELITYCEFACYRLVCSLRDLKAKKSNEAEKIAAEVANEKLLGPQRAAMEELKLTFIDHESGYFTNHASGNLIIRIYGAEPLEFKYEMTKENESYRKFCSIVLGDADDRNHTYFRCRFPEPGEYFLKLFGKNPAAENQDWLMFAFYMIKVPHGSKRKNFTPKCTCGYFGLSPTCDKSLLVTHKGPYFFTKENKLLMTFFSENFMPEIKMNFFYFDVSHSSKGHMAPVDNLMFFDRYLIERKHVQCELEMMSRGVYVLEIFRRKKTTKLVPKPIDPDEELVKILDDLHDNTSVNSGFAEELVEVTETEDEYLMTYGIDYIGPEIPNSEVNEFPDIFSGWTGACKLFEPRMRFLPALKTTLFRLSVPWAKEVRVKGRSTTTLDCEKRGLFSFNILVGMYNESVMVQAMPFPPSDAENPDEPGHFVDLLKFEVDFGNIEMADADELGRVQKRVQEAIDMAWHHLGQVAALEQEVEILESKHIRDTDGLYEHAKRLIPFFKIRERLVIAMSNMDYEELKTTLKEIEQSSDYQKWLELEYPRAKRLYKQMSARLQIKNKKRELNQTCVTEIRRFNNPQYLLHQVMMGVFALLGYPHAKIKKWEFIQREMGKPGREGTLFKMQSCKAADVDEKQFSLAVKTLSTIDESEVKSFTSSAAAFYDWAMKKVKLVEKHLNGEDVTQEESSTAVSTARRDRSQESRPDSTSRHKHTRQTDSLFEDEHVKELLSGDSSSKSQKQPTNNRPSTTQSGRVDSTAIPVDYEETSVKTIVSQSRPRTAVSVTRSRPSTNQTERIISDDKDKSQGILETEKQEKHQQFEETDNLQKKDEEKEENTPSEVAKKETEKRAAPTKLTEKSHSQKSIGKKSANPDSKTKKKSPERVSSAMKKNTKQENSDDQPENRKGGVLHVILSDEIDQVDIDEVDEITERRKQQEKGHGKNLDRKQESQRSITSSNMLSPPQLEHEKLVEKLDVLAKEQKESRLGAMPPPTPRIIPPTPLLVRGGSSHSLTSNTSEKENQQKLSSRGGQTEKVKEIVPLY